MPWQMIAALAAGIISFVLAIVFLIWFFKNHRRARGYTGAEFEEYCAGLLKRNGFREVQLTRASGDFGVDIFAKKDGVTWAFQCKCYDKPVGIRAVQEIYSGRDFYRCMVGVVITNNTYTKAAKELAQAHKILLWDKAQVEALERS